MNNSGCEIGLVGLGVMGRNLVLNIGDRGFSVAVHNRPTEIGPNWHTCSSILILAKR